ncbi:MFS transporter [Megamonas hypermegale]|uniref:MFS transporter n=1 Tax=Megamonas hypermegale TaxID=158847 RepID=UPI0026F2A3CB|nr:MFS transporter [Megamonas hypermegale]
MNAVLFLTSQAITLFGSTVIQMAIVWYITVQTLSGEWMALCSISAYLPQFIVSFGGGVWADYYNRKFLIITADAVIAVITLIAIIFMSYLNEDISVFYLLLCISLFRSVGTGIQTPAVNATVVQIVSKERLTRFNGINMAIQSAIQFTAPIAAGIILLFFSLPTVLFLDILTAIIGIGIMYKVSIPQIQVKEKRSSVWQDMQNGLKYVFENKFVFRILFVYGIFIFLCIPPGFMAGLFVSRTFENSYEYLTFTEITGFAGMSFGGLLMSIWGGFSRKAKMLRTGLIIFGAMAVIMGITNNFRYYLVFMLIFGMAMTIVQTVITTILQEKTEEYIQGRVFGLVSSLYAGLLPIGMAVFGLMADVVSLSSIIVFSGIILMVLSCMVK